MNEVAGVAHVVERFVGVFYRNLDGLRVLKEVGVDSVVETRAMAATLVGREDEELGDPRARWDRMLERSVIGFEV